MSALRARIGLKWSEGDIPEAGSTDGSCHSNAGLGGDGYCTPAAMATRAAAVGRSLSCVLAGATVVAGVAEVGRSWRCMEVVGLGCLEGEEGSSALRRSSRLLPCLMLYSSGIYWQDWYKAAEG